MKRTMLSTFVLGAAIGFLLPANAQQSAESGPALGVARISLVNGDVSTRRGDSGDWVVAGMNAPIVEGDMIATGPGARAEVQLDYSNLVRLAGGTEVQLGSLGQRNFRLQLFNGRITYSELRGGDADVDIETPQAAIRPHKNGRYEIETRPGETVIQVRKGEAEVFSSEGSEIVKKGRMLVIRDGTDGIEVRLSSAEPRGEWDDWNKERDSRLSNLESYRYVSDSITGAADLQGYGDWRYVSGYGYTWYPQVSIGWAPYRHGHWSWTNYYGWTWIGSEPWGWAPYHYGRWSHHPSYGWGWYPGRRHYRHHWRPALVGFFGYNSHHGWSAGIGFGYGHVGWVPLAPGEAYHPWYGGGRYGRHGGNVKIKNSTVVVDNSVNIYNDYRNARVRNGTTVVDAEGFSRGRSDNPRSLGRDDLGRATAMRGDVPVVPTRQAQGALRGIRTSTSASGDTTARRTTYSRTGVRATTRPRQASFDQQRQRVATSVRQLRTQGPTTTTARATTTRSTQTRGRSSPRVSGTVRSTTAASRRATTANTGVRSGTTTRRSGSTATRAAVGTRAAERSSRTYSAPSRDSRRSRGTQTVRPTGSSRTGQQNTLQQRNNRVDSRPTVRDSRPAARRSDSSRTTTRSRTQTTLQQRNNRIDNGPILRDRGSSRTTTAPSRSQSRVNRNSTRSTGASPRTRSVSPTRQSQSRSRISPRASQPRTSRAPSSQTRSRAPQARAPRSAPSRSAQPRTRSQPTRQSQPRASGRSAPSHSSAPRASAPRSSSRGSASPRSSGGSRGGGTRGSRR